MYDRPRARTRRTTPPPASYHQVESHQCHHPHPQRGQEPADINRPAGANQKKLAEKPILVSALTGSLGSITLLVPSYSGARPLNIRAKSNNGNITIYLPSSFAGLLNWSSETGTLKVSKAMQQRFKPLDSPPHKHRGTAKIVPSTASGLRGDVCTIANNHGSITIKDFDEDAAGGGGGGGGGDKSCLIQ